MTRDAANDSFSTPFGQQIITPDGHKARLKIREAFPKMFEKAYPAVDPTTPILSVLPLLHFHEIDVLPLSFDDERRQKGVSGFSCLATLMKVRPEEVSSFLKQPCEVVSKPLATIRADWPLSSLLDVFLRRRFGFARVVERKGAGALLTLPDVLGLYQDGTLRSALTLEDVGSTAFSVPGESTIKEVLVEMFGRGIRRVFISETHEFVWDRSIIERLFSPAVLARAARRESENILEIPISEMRATTAKEAEGRMQLREAAALLKVEPGQCLVFSGKVVTPWDIVMKPWKERELKIRSHRQQRSELKGART
jgi:hypothetical protein